MTEYDSLNAFFEDVCDLMPEEWDINATPAKPNETRAGFIRDDLTGALIQHSTKEEWPPEDLYVIVAKEAGVQVVDRPNSGYLYDLNPNDAAASAETIIQNMPEYEGTFEYDD